MDNKFLLKSPRAEKLYETYAKDLPVIDYHNHLPIDAIKDNKPFENITKMWISADPYKHRLMRICGVEEKYITGNGTDFEKFSKWCCIYPELLGTPVYEWCKMELEEVFGCNMPMCGENAEKLWDILNKKVKELTPKGLLESFKVEYAAPCHGLTEDVSFYEGEKKFAPSLRCDDMLKPSAEFLEKLEVMTEMKIETVESYKKAISIRLDAFEKAGCRFADISLDNGFEYDGKAAVNLNDVKWEIVRFTGSECAKRGMTLQLHIGAQRETSSRLCSVAGKAGGYAAIGDEISIKGLTSLLDDIEKIHGKLPKTILFTLNPAYNSAFAILSGSYSADGKAAIVTQGPPWWWCDHKRGMEQFFEEFSSYSVLSTLVGMTTDSRSFLSFVRHDYFRRVLCSWLAEKVEKGDYPENYELLGRIINKICYQNAKDLI